MAAGRAAPGNEPLLSETISTLPQRKAAEAARRRRVAGEAVRELRDYARSHGGAFVVFGSFVKDAMRFDSDLDVMVDFPVEASADAWRHVEAVCEKRAIPVDLHDARTTKPAFADRVRRTGLVLA